MMMMMMMMTTAAAAAAEPLVDSEDTSGQQNAEQLEIW